MQIMRRSRWKTLGVIVAGCTMAVAVAAQSQAQGDRVAAAEIAAMKSDYRRPAPRSIDNKALVDLGRMLFWDPRVSASGGSSCVGCHYPYLGWAVTDPRSRNASGKPTPRTSQRLSGVGHIEAPVGGDGRNASLEAQAQSSIATGSMSMRETETPVKVEMIEERIRSDPAYVAKFNAAMPGTPVNIDSIVKAIAVFERTLEPGTAPFDRWVEG